jgi:hypothetical protein
VVVTFLTLNGFRSLTIVLKNSQEEKALKELGTGYCHARCRLCSALLWPPCLDSTFTCCFSAGGEDAEEEALLHHMSIIQHAILDANGRTYLRARENAVRSCLPVLLPCCVFS